MKLLAQRAKFSVQRKCPNVHLLQELEELKHRLKSSTNEFLTLLLNNNSQLIFDILNKYLKW